MNISFDNYAKKIDSREIRGATYDWYKWRVFVNAPDDVLDNIEYVEYLLHPTFPRPNRRINYRPSKFALELEGWGSFGMSITIRFKDGTEKEYSYYLDLSKPWPEHG